MTMNSSGPISLGGTTSGQSIEIENGGPGTATISLNDTTVRSLAGVPGSGTTIIMPTNFYGKSNTVTINVTISSSTQNYCVYSAISSNPSYIAGKTNATITINPGVNVGSSATGSYAMLVPGSFNSADTVTIVNNGYIVGAGGNGGAGGQGSFAGQPGFGGGGGGNALYVNRPTTVTNNGTIGAGGGGGGGGGGACANQCNGFPWGGAGGGGAAGYNAGSAGNGGPSGTGGGPGSPGSPGTLTSGGGGGGGASFRAGRQNYTTGSGGSGGGLGSGGSPGTPASGVGTNGGGGPGGGSANYITGNSYVTWPATGTRLGGVA